MKVIFLGSGNLATRLSLEMHRKGIRIGQVYSHTPENAQQLAALLGCPWTTDPEAVETDADLYVFSLKDTVLVDVIARVRPNDGLWVHTAGSMLKMPVSCNNWRRNFREMSVSCRPTNVNVCIWQLSLPAILPTIFMRWLLNYCRNRIYRPMFCCRL